MEANVKGRSFVNLPFWISEMTEEEMMDLALRLSEQEASVAAIRLQKEEEEAMMKAIEESVSTVESEEHGRNDLQKNKNRCTAETNQTIWFKDFSSVKSYNSVQLIDN